MKVLVEVPEAIVDRFQFIPEEELPEVLAQLIQAGLEGTGAPKEKEPVPELAELLDAIRVLQTQGVPVASESREAASEGFEEEVSSFKVSKVEPELLPEDEDMLGDFMDLLK